MKFFKYDFLDELALWAIDTGKMSSSRICVNTTTGRVTGETQTDVSVPTDAIEIDKQEYMNLLYYLLT